MGLLSSLTLELSWIFFLSLTVALKEMYEIYSTPHPKFYFMQLENIGQWLLIAIIGLTSIPIFTKNIYPWQYQLAAVGLSNNPWLASWYVMAKKPVHLFISVITYILYF